MRVDYFLYFRLLVSLLLFVTAVFAVVIFIHCLNTGIIFHFCELGHSVLLNVVSETHDYYLSFFDFLALFSSTLGLVFYLFQEVPDDVRNVMNYRCRLIKVLREIYGKYESPSSRLIDSKPSIRHTFTKGFQ